MIGPFGVTPAGVVPKQQSDIVGQMSDALQADFGAAFQTLTPEPLGQVLLRTGEQIADLWQFGVQIINSFSPNTAQGIYLDAARYMTNQFRIPATASVANGVVISGTPGTPVPANFQLSVQGNSASVFQISAATTIGVGGTVVASFVALSTGPTYAPANTLNVIVNAVAGITGAVNSTTDAELGAVAESDAAFRLRSAQNLGKPGTGTFSGNLNAVLAVPNVSVAYEQINDGDVADSNGNAPHSIRLIVVGGVDQDVGNAIFAAKGAGIGTNGNTQVSVIDSQDITHFVKFDRLAYVPIYMSVALTVNSNPAAGPVYPSNGDTLMEAAILAYGATFLPGQTVITTGFFTPINTIPGVLSAVIHISTAPAPTLPNNIAMLPYQVATFSAANLVITP